MNFVLSILVLLFYFFEFCFSTGCKVYQCATSHGLKIPPPQCIWSHVINGTQVFDIDKSNCKVGEQCLLDPVSDVNVTCSNIEKKKSFDREPCNNNTDCYSMICNNGFCTGKAEQVLCNNHNECMNGYFCGFTDLNNSTIPKKCLKQRTLGNVCDDDYYCTNDMGCYRENTTSKIGKCIKYLSLPNGSPVVENKPELCESHFLLNGFCIDTVLKTSEKCLFGQTSCNYTYVLDSKEYSFSRDCSCSDSHHDSLYCPMASTNQVYRSYVSELRNFYGRGVLKKHTLKRTELDYALRVLRLKSISFPKIKDADECYINFVANTKLVSLSVWVISLIFTLLL